MKGERWGTESDRLGRAFFADICLAAAAPYPYQSESERCGEHNYDREDWIAQGQGHRVAVSARRDARDGAGDAKVAVGRVELSHWNVGESGRSILAGDLCELFAPCSREGDVGARNGLPEYVDELDRDRIYRERYRNSFGLGHRERAICGDKRRDQHPVGRGPNERVLGAGVEPDGRVGRRDSLQSLRAGDGRFLRRYCTPDGVDERQIDQVSGLICGYHAHIGLDCEIESGGNGTQSSLPADEKELGGVPCRGDSLGRSGVIRADGPAEAHGERMLDAVYHNLSRAFPVAQERNRGGRRGRPPYPQDGQREDRCYLHIPVRCEREFGAVSSLSAVHHPLTERPSSGRNGANRDQLTYRIVV